MRLFLFLIGIRVLLHVVYWLWFDWQWAALVPKDKRPAILNERHGDFRWPFSLIPRSLTAFLSNVPPIKLLGTERVEDGLDIPERGRWILAFPLYFALTTKGGVHFRIGDRWDHEKYYRPCAFTIKRLG